MGYSVTVGSIVEVSLVGKIDDQVCMTVLHYRLKAASVLTDGDALLGDVAAALNAATGLVNKYAACMVDAYQITDLRLQWIHPTRYHYRSFAPIAPSGALAEPPMPANVSAAITKRGVLANRHGHGNVHMPGVSQTFVANSEITAAGLLAYSALADKIDDVISVGDTDEYEPIIYTRGDPASSQVVFDCSVHTESRVERRRTKGLGI